MQVYTGEEDSSACTLMLHSRLTFEMTIIASIVRCKVIIADINLTVVSINGTTLFSGVIKEVVVRD